MQCYLLSNHETPQKRDPTPQSLYTAHMLSSVLTERKTGPLTTDKMSDAEPIRRKLPKGKK